MMLESFLQCSLREAAGHLQYRNPVVPFTKVFEDIPSTALCLVITYSMMALVEGRGGERMYEAGDLCAFKCLQVLANGLQMLYRLHCPVVVGGEIIAITEVWQHDLGPIRLRVLLQGSRHAPGSVCRVYSGE